MMQLAAKKPVATAKSLPAPVGGWNARDGLPEMRPTDAVSLLNWWPRPTDVMLRQGYEEHATGLPDQVESLLVYNAQDGTSELFGVADGEIYDVSAAGAVGAAVVSTLSNSRWEFVNTATSGGSYLYAVNGVDDPLLYDGSTWTPINGASSPAITGVTTSTLSNVNLFKTRLFFIERDSLSVWYLAAGAISGAATELDLSAVASKGGYLIAMGTWTLDAGYGVDDYAVFVTSQGQIIVYRGTDPSMSSSWTLVGVWNLGAPIGRRCLFKWGGDLLILTEDGLLPLSKALQSERLDKTAALTDKIQAAISESVTLYGANFGWQALSFPKQNMLILNVPTAVGQQEQYVMNLITKGWARFQGWAANCWALFEDEIYFGADTVVCKAWSGFADAGTNINGDALQAFNYFGTPGLLKRFTMMQPVLLTDGDPVPYVNVNVDFDLTPPVSPISTAPTAYGIWDVGVWDLALWGGALTLQNFWQDVAGVGYCAAPRVLLSTQGTETHWVSSVVVYEKGGIL